MFPEKRKVVRSVMFDESPDTWYELSCGHFVRKVTDEEQETARCSACVNEPSAYRRRKTEAYQGRVPHGYFLWRGELRKKVGLE
jgi:hypothetical protein